MPSPFFDTKEGRAPIKDDFVNQVNRNPENDIQNTCHQANESGDDNHPGVFSREKLAERFFHFCYGTVQPTVSAR